MEHDQIDLAGVHDTGPGPRPATSARSGLALPPGLATILVITAVLMVALRLL